MCHEDVPCGGLESSHEQYEHPIIVEEKEGLDDDRK